MEGQDMIQLNETDIRVLGALVEKAITTPEYYPLTLNALVNACNQKSNREPVVQYDARTVDESLRRLREQGLVQIIMGGDSRVPKYKQFFAEFFELNPAEEAILCELLLRGPQTVGELRGRTERLGNRQEADAVQAALDALMARPEPLVIRLPRQPGQKDTRYMHLLAGEPDLAALAVVQPSEPAASQRERIDRLEATVERLQQELAELRQEFAAFRTQFE
jgi:uncharacterized protein YceH (UPF0502 family)